MNYPLEPSYDGRASFYGKARVSDKTEPNGKGTNRVFKLTSYSTHVATVTLGANGTRTAEVYGTYSATTLRHIKEFLKQHGFKADTARQIMADYGGETAV